MYTSLNHYYSTRAQEKSPSQELSPKRVDAQKMLIFLARPYPFKESS